MKFVADAEMSNAQEYEFLRNNRYTYLHAYGMDVYLGMLTSSCERTMSEFSWKHFN